jgi:hypothetical protein
VTFPGEDTSDLNWHFCFDCPSGRRLRGSFSDRVPPSEAAFQPPFEPGGHSSQWLTGEGKRDHRSRLVSLSTRRLLPVR